MTDSEELLEQNIQILAKFLLSDEICNASERRKKQNVKTPKLQDLKNQSQNFHFNIGYFMNPFYLVLPSENQPPKKRDERLRNCIQNSKESQNLSILLKSVEELPKLRYQQSEKLFTGQTEQITNDCSKEQVISTKLNCQTPSINQSALKMVKTVELTQQTPQNLPNRKMIDSKKPESKFKFELPSNHKIIDLQQPSQQEQNDIEMNMSARSHYEVHITREDGENYEKKVQQHYSMRKKNHQYEHFQRNKYQAESQKKAKDEKSMIQNYFDSAKNRVLENCHMNCCQGIFPFSQQQNYDPSSIQMIHLNQESQFSKKQAKRK